MNSLKICTNLLNFTWIKVSDIYEKKTLYNGYINNINVDIFIKYLKFYETLCIIII